MLQLGLGRAPMSSELLALKQHWRTHCASARWCRQYPSISVSLEVVCCVICNSRVPGACTGLLTAPTVLQSLAVSLAQKHRFGHGPNIQSCARCLYWTPAFCCLQALTRVTKLNLYGCKRLTVQGLAKLVPLPLVALSLGQTRIRPDALDTLTRMAGLTELHLVREYMGTALVKLSALSALEVLSLRSTELTNETATVSQMAPREGAFVNPISQQRFRLQQCGFTRVQSDCRVLFVHDHRKLPMSGSYACAEV